MWGKPIFDLNGDDAQRIRNWSSGVVETRSGQLESVRWRLLSRRISRFGIWIDRQRRIAARDRCWLYWRRPFFQRGVIAVTYVRSAPQTSIATIHRAVRVLDDIARLQGSLVAVCNITNDRISDRLLRRWGWEEHCHEWRGRHFIRRYYLGDDSTHIPR